MGASDAMGQCAYLQLFCLLLFQKQHLWHYQQPQPSWGCGFPQARSGDLARSESCTTGSDGEACLTCVAFPTGD